MFTSLVLPQCAVNIRRSWMVTRTRAYELPLICGVSMAAETRVLPSTRILGFPSECGWQVHLFYSKSYHLFGRYHADRRFKFGLPLNILNISFRRTTSAGSRFRTAHETTRPDRG